MKSVGILTFYKSENVGAVLQACALQNVLTEMGYTAQIIQYVDQKKKQSRIPTAKRIAHNLWYDGIKRGLLRDIKWRRICDFVEKYDSLSEKAYFSHAAIHKDPPLYDVYITGSDQVWNPSITGNDETYYLTFAPAEAVRLSYGASLGNISVLQRDPEKTAYMLRQLDAISVREKDAACAISDMIHKPVTQVLDPTLLLDAEKWTTFIAHRKPVVKQPYILCYYMPGNSAMEEGIRNIADTLRKKTGLPVVNIGKKDWQKLRFCKEDLFDHGPLEFLWLIKNAAYVVTNSFHGTAFSINFGKPFYVPTADNESTAATRTSRILSLLSALKLEERLIPVDANGNITSPKITEQSLDYTEAHSKLAELRDTSVAFLRNGCEGKIKEP